MAFIDSLRAAADNGLAVVAYKSLNPFQVWLVEVTNDQVNFDDPNNARVRTDTRITVGTGHTSVSPAPAPGDGYLYPHVQFMSKADSNQVEVLSGLALSDMDLMLGPLTFPYNTGLQAGGYDPDNFQPPPSGADNTQIYVHLIGLGLNQANGNYFKVKEIALLGMDNVTYYVRLEHISDVIPS